MFSLLSVQHRRKQIGVRTIAGAAVPWLVGAVCSLVASVDYQHLVEFDVCRQSVVYRRHTTRDDGWPTVSWTAALVVAYWLAVVLAGAWLIVAYFWNRKLLASTLLRRDATLLRDRSGLSRDEGRRKTSCISGAGASLSDDGAGDSAEVTSRHDSSRRKRQGRKHSGERANKSSQVCRCLVYIYPAPCLGPRTTRRHCCDPKSNIMLIFIT